MFMKHLGILWQEGLHGKASHFGVTKAMPSVGLVWDELVTPLQLLPAPNWLQLLLGTQVPLSSCQAVATALCFLHLQGYHGYMELQSCSHMAAGIVWGVR